MDIIYLSTGLVLIEHVFDFKKAENFTPCIKREMDDDLNETYYVQMHSVRNLSSLELLL